MSPLIQPKTNELMSELRVLVAEEKRSDITVMKLKREFEKLHAADPLNSFLGLAIIASQIDRNKIDTQKYFKTLIDYSKNDPVMILNYATALDSFSDFDAAREQLAIALKNIDKNPSILQEIARLIYILSAQELFHEVIRQANNFELTSKEIHTIACEVALANADNEQESIEILEKETFLNDPILIDDERWAQIQSLADELS